MRKDDQPDRYIRFAGLFSIPESLIRYVPWLFSEEEIEAALRIRRTAILPDTTVKAGWRRNTAGDF